MAIPYALIHAFDKGGSPNLKRLENVSPKKAMEFLMQPGKMKGEYLGACLDSCRWGSAVDVMWETDINGMMAFIQKWRDENNDNPELYHRIPLMEMYTKFELPHIDHEKCPSNDSHKETILDAGGRIRCAHRSTSKIRKGFIESYSNFDEKAQLKTISFSEYTPTCSSYEDDNGEEHFDKYELKRYKKEKERFDNAELESVIDACYAIISDKSLVLPFETILRRLNDISETETVYCPGYGIGKCKRIKELPKEDRDMYSAWAFCPGHEEHVNKVVFSFDGWDLAYYVQKWKEQSQNAPWFAEKKEQWSKKKFRYAGASDFED